MHASIHLLRIVKIDTKSVLLVPLLGRIWCKIQTGLCLVSIPCWIWCCYCKLVNGRCQLYAPSIVATFCGWHTFFWQIDGCNNTLWPQFSPHNTVGNMIFYDNEANENQEWKSECKTFNHMIIVLCN